MYTNDDLLRALIGSGLTVAKVQDILGDLLQANEYIQCRSQYGESAIELADERCVTIPRLHRELLPILEGHARRVDEQRRGARDPGYLLGAAARAGNRQKVKTYLDKGVNPNLPGPGGEPAVYHAAIKGHLEVLDDLVRAGADLNAPGVKHKNILHAVFFDGDIGIVEHLLRTYSLDINVQDYSGNTLLHMAAEKGLVSIAQNLLEFSPDHLIMNKKGKRPDQIACIWDYSEFGSSKKPSPEIFELIKKYHEEYQRKRQILQQIQASGHEVNLSNLCINDCDLQDILRQLSQMPYVVVLNLSGTRLANFSVNTLKTELLSKTNIIEISLDKTYISPQAIQKIQEAISPFNRLKEMLRKDFPFYQTEHLPFVTMLVQRSDDRILALADERTGWHLIHYAAFHGNLALVSCLMTRRVPINSIVEEKFGGKNETALHLAAEQGHSDVLRELLRDPDSRELFHSRDQDLKTALQLAVERQHTDSVCVLLEAGNIPKDILGLFNITKKNNDERTFALLLSFLKPSLALIDSIASDTSEDIQRKVVEYKQPYEGFFKAAQEGDVSYVSKCLSEGMDITACKDGHTLLYFSATNKHKDTCIALLASGANFSENELEDAVNKKKNPFGYYFNDEAFLKEICDTLLKDHFLRFDENGALIGYFMSRARLAGKSPPFNLQEMYKRFLSGKYCTEKGDHYFRPLLEVLEYSRRPFHLILDARYDHVANSNIQPEITTGTKGSVNPTTLRIYIGGKRPEREIAGTVIHEFTHFVCDILYENKCNPFRFVAGGSDQERKFRGVCEDAKFGLSGKDPILQRVFYEYNDPYTIFIMQNLPATSEAEHHNKYIYLEGHQELYYCNTHGIFETVSITDVEAFANLIKQQAQGGSALQQTIRQMEIDKFTMITQEHTPPGRFLLELIVRVPHMLAEYGATEGLKRLKAQAPDLLDFYVETLLRDCHKYIEDKKRELFTSGALGHAIQDLFLEGATVTAQISTAASSSTSASAVELAVTEPIWGGDFSLFDKRTNRLDLDAALQILDRQERTQYILTLVREGQTKTNNPDRVIGICEGYLASHPDDEELTRQLETMQSALTNRVPYGYH